MTAVQLIRHPRPLAALLVLLLVPVIVLTSGSGAQAATVTYGASAEASLVKDSKIDSATGADAACNVSAHWRLDGVVMGVVGSVSCTTGYQFATFFVTLTFKGSGCPGDAVAELGADLDGDTSAHAFTAPIGIVSAGCSITTVCADFDGDSHTSMAGFGRLTGDPDCVPINIGGPDSVDGSADNGQCTSGTVVRPRLDGAPYQDPGDGNDSTWRQAVQFSMGSKSGNWVFYTVTVLADGSGGSSPVPAGDLEGGATPMVKARLSGGGSVFVAAPSFNQTGDFAQTTHPALSVFHMNGLSAGYLATHRVIGAGYFKRTNNALTVDGTVGNDTNGGLVGITDPGRCAFYWGDKIALTANTDVDEPSGTVDTSGGVPPVEPPSDVEPPTADTSCQGFSFTDPSSWAGAGICQLVKLIGALIDAIGHILDGLVDILMAAFVPHPDSWGFDGLVDQFQTRPPGSLVTAAAAGVNGVVSSYDGSGCGTIADFTSSDTHGSAKVTCTQIRSVPGFSGLYTLCQVAIWAMAGLALFRMAGAAFKGE